MEVIRQDIANYICKRDNGVPSNPDDIFLATGGSTAIRVKILLE